MCFSAIYIVEAVMKKELVSPRRTRSPKGELQLSDAVDVIERRDYADVTR
jgi:hypothetical protein